MQSYGHNLNFNVYLFFSCREGSTDQQKTFLNKEIYCVRIEIYGNI